MPSLLERLEFRNGLANLVLLGSKLLLLDRELLKLLLRSDKLLLLDGKFLYIAADGTDVLRQCFQSLAQIRR